MCLKQVHIAVYGCKVSEHFFPCAAWPLCTLETRKTYNSTLCNVHWTGDRTVGAGRPAPGEEREVKFAQTTLITYERPVNPSLTQSKPAQTDVEPTQFQRQRARTEVNPARLQRQRAGTEPQPKRGLEEDYRKETWKGTEDGNGDEWRYVGKWKGTLDPEAKEFKPAKR